MTKNRSRLLNLERIFQIEVFAVACPIFNCDENDFIYFLTHEYFKDYEQKYALDGFAMPWGLCMAG